MHIIFSTKNRDPLINIDFQNEIHLYMAGICRDENCPTIAIGGYTDHIHLLCMMSKKITISDFVGKLKSHSSKWIKNRFESLQNFYWQDGYGAFGVSNRNIPEVMAYIGRQTEHHTRVNFQEEYRKLLDELGVEFDERYVWG